MEITLQLVPTATISGTVRTTSGALPSSLVVHLAPAGPQTEMLAGAWLRGVSTPVQADGRYVFTGVAPGSYSVGAVVGWGRGTAPTGPAHWASADVHASGEDLFVPLTLQPGVPITGRVVFEGVQPTPTELEIPSPGRLLRADNRAHGGSP